MWDLIIGGALVVLALLVPLGVGLLRAAARPAPAPAPQRPVYRCSAGRGPTKCTAPATRIVLLIAGPTESAVMCDDDAFRAARIGHAVDLGPINRPTR